MMGIGFPELMIILIIIMIIFGAGKLPEIGSAFGRSIKNFKTSMKEAEEGDQPAVEGSAAEGDNAAAGEIEGGEELSKEEQEKIAREKLQAELTERDKQREEEADAFTASLPKKGSYDFAKDQEDLKNKKEKKEKA
jgi:TatA/E family protein of Tat protein translocase